MAKMLNYTETIESAEEFILDNSFIPKDQVDYVLNDIEAEMNLALEKYDNNNYDYEDLREWLKEMIQKF